MKQAATILQETSCELCITNDSEPAGMVCLKLDLGGPKKEEERKWVFDRITFIASTVWD